MDLERMPKEVETSVLQMNHSHVWRRKAKVSQENEDQ